MTTPNASSEPREPWKPSTFMAAFNAYADEHASHCHQPRPSITPGMARLLVGFLKEVDDAR